MADVRAVEVRIWGKMVGAVAAFAGKPGFYEFEYDPEFAASGIELSPLMMPCDSRTQRFAFPSLGMETYHGLPGLLADALPDLFGNLLIDEYMSRNGIRPDEISTLQRLLYVGRRGMGALEFEPAYPRVPDPGAAAPIEMAHLVEDARRALRGELGNIAQDIIDVGSSAGGARAKAVIGWNESTGEIVSGQFELPPGFGHWLLKFDVGADRQLGTTKGFGRIEYAHYRVALDAGIEMSECRLLEENGRAHFMTRRFDRVDNRKIHVHSLCGMAHLDFNAPYVHGYVQYLRTILQLGLGARAIEQGWLRCAFNVAAVNCDDHTKNLAFMLEAGTGWSLAPAYDMCFAHNPARDRWTRQHQMLVDGKAWEINEQDLIALGEKFDVNRPREKLEQVIEAVNRWPVHAKEAGIAPEKIRQITALQPFSTPHRAR